jgi:hypothetical protein
VRCSSEPARTGRSDLYNRMQPGVSFEVSHCSRWIPPNSTGIRAGRHRDPRLETAFANAWIRISQFVRATDVTAVTTSAVCLLSSGLRVSIPIRNCPSIPVCLKGSYHRGEEYQFSSTFRRLRQCIKIPAATFGTCVQYVLLANNSILSLTTRSHSPRSIS